MKQIEWINGNRMKFESEHKTFNRQVDAISTGNVVGSVQYSNFIRGYNETECNGFTNPPGHLQNWDLTKNIVKLSGYIREAVRKLTHDKGGIIYNFYHRSGYRRIDDGFVLTTKDYELVKTWYINRDWRAMGAVNEAIKYITN